MTEFMKKTSSFFKEMFVEPRQFQLFGSKTGPSLFVVGGEATARWSSQTKSLQDGTEGLYHWDGAV